MFHRTYPPLGGCLLECLESNLTVNETHKTTDCEVLEDGSPEWHVKTTLEELRLKEFCSENEDGEDIIKYCPELPSLSGVSIKCVDEADEKYQTIRFLRMVIGHFLLNCTNSQQIVEAYRVLHCRAETGMWLWISLSWI